MVVWKDFTKGVGVGDGGRPVKFTNAWLQSKGLGDGRVFRISRRGSFAVLHRYHNPPRYKWRSDRVARRIPKIVRGWPDELQ